ncbi:MAG: nuclear transport factor 2 family protein [Acidobacteriota bacterium]|nr:MAG: nuclear transport factor 2 family protein [Acidobacteriota bacterium]
MVHTESSNESRRAIAEVIELNERMAGSLSHGDLSVLERVMAPEARVNGPNDKVATGQQVIERFRKGELAHGEYERKIEEAYVSGDVVVLMGEEVVKMRGSNQANVSEEMRRRFTSVWRKNHGQWQQIARQATNVGSVP